MRKSIPAILTSVLVASVPTLATAGSLQVTPVSLDLPPSASSATIKLRNEGAAPLNAQIRVFRWMQENGEEKLVPTDEVVASPPIATLAGKTDYTVRVVRVSKEPLKASSYRLVVDELPDKSQQKDGVVNIVLRYSIPVFFYSAEAERPKLTWSVTQRGSRLYVTAKNDGDRHVRLAGLKLQPANGSAISLGEGLAGYVLGRSTMNWAAPHSKRPIGGTPVAITALSDSGPISASAVMPSNR